MKWKAVLESELKNALVEASDGIPRKNITFYSEIFTPPPRRKQKPANFGFKPTMAVLNKIVTPSTSKTLEPLNLSKNRYKAFRSVPASEDLFGYSFFGEFRNRLIANTEYHLRRLALEATIHADNDPHPRPGFNTKFRWTVGQARRQFRINLKNIVNGHVGREGELSETVRGRIAAAETYGDAAAAVLPVYTAALGRGDS